MSQINMEKIAELAFIAFVIIAIIAGLAIGYMAYDKYNTFDAGFSHPDVANAHSYVLMVMLILGVVVGLVSITAKEAKMYLIAAIALIVASTANVWTPLAKINDLLAYWATGILQYIAAFVAPAAVIIALKAVFDLSRTK